MPARRPTDCDMAYLPAPTPLVSLACTCREAAHSRWRVLRTHHAMRVFQDRIRSTEFAEPSDRLAMFASLRNRQRETLAALSKHVAGVSALAPPNMSSRKVAAWREEALKRHAEWVAELGDWASRLRSHEVRRCGARAPSGR